MHTDKGTNRNMTHHSSSTRDLQRCTGPYSLMQTFELLVSPMQMVCVCVCVCVRAHVSSC